MKTTVHNQFRQSRETEVAAPTSATDTDVSHDASVCDVAAGIADILNIRVGCWQAPIYPWAGPTAA